MSALLQAVIELSSTQVRMLRKGEHIPLDHGLPNPDSDWTWVLQHQGVIVGCIMVAPCHGVIQIVRLVMEKGHEWRIPKLLRQCISDCSDWGYSGFVVWLDEEESSGKKLMQILKRAGAVAMPGLHKCVAISSANLRRW